MATFLFIILLSLLVLAPQLRAIKVSEPEQIILFGLPTLAMTIELDIATLFANEAYWGPVLYAIEEAMELRSWNIDPPVNSYTRPVLGNQTSKSARPSGLIQLTLVGLDGNIAKPVFRRDNLYLSGFANRFEQYFVLKGHEHVLVGATELQLNDEYSQLLGPGGLKNLNTFPLGKAPFWEAITFLANIQYDGIDNHQLGKALATIVLMIPESLRILPIHVKVTQIWASGTVGYLDPEEDAKFIHNWGRMLALILCLSRNQPLRGTRATQLEQISYITLESTLPVVMIMLWPMNFDESNLFVSCGDQPRRRNGLPE